MKIREIMTRNVVSGQPESSLEQIAMMMRDNDTGVIPIVDRNKLMGVVTDRDIVVRCIAEGKDPVEAKAEDVLSEDLQTIEPDADIDDAADLMSEHQIRRLPVVEKGKLVGMLSLGDMAVKSEEDDITAEALENVSEGVKASQGSRREGQRTQGRGQRGGGAGKLMEFPAHGSGGREGRQQTMAQGRGRQSGQSRGEGRSQQGIANRSRSEEQGRQSRVAGKNEGKSRRRVS
jgi:CBS domain-containing protein